LLALTDAFFVKIGRRVAVSETYMRARIPSLSGLYSNHEKVSNFTVSILAESWWFTQA